MIQSNACNMQELQVQITQIEKIGNGKRRIHFEGVESLILYYSETRGYSLEEGIYISVQFYEKLRREIVGKRAKKRALHLLEQMDRTEQQLREKLQLSEYPESCVDDAIEYVKSFHYLDDRRYAENFTRYKKEKLSCQQIKQKLMQKGVSRDIIADAVESEYDADELVHIRALLEKKHFSREEADEGEFRRVYNYLLRRGFRSSDILKEMQNNICKVSQSDPHLAVGYF